MKLHCLKGDHQAAKILTLMLAVDESCEVIFLNPKTYKKDPRLLKISPSAKSPVLESDLQPLYETNTILRYIARRYKERGFAGLLPQEEAQIDQYLEFVSNQLDPLIEQIYHPYINLTPFNLSQERALISLARCLKDLEDDLLEKRFLIGYGATLADLSVLVSLTCPIKPIYDRYFAKQFPRLTAWLDENTGFFRLHKIPKCFRVLTVSLGDGEEVIGSGIKRFKKGLKSGKIFKDDYKFESDYIVERISKAKKEGKAKKDKKTRKKDKGKKRKKKSKKSKKHKSGKKGFKSSPLLTGLDGVKVGSSAFAEDLVEKSEKSKTEKSDKKKRKKRSKKSRGRSSSSRSSSGSSSSSGGSESSSSSDSADEKIKKLKKRNRKLAREMREIRRKFKKLARRLSSSSLSSSTISSSDSSSDSSDSSDESSRSRKKRKSKKRRKRRKHKKHKKERKETESSQHAKPDPPKIEIVEKVEVSPKSIAKSNKAEEEEIPVPREPTEEEKEEHKITEESFEDKAVEPPQESSEEVELPDETEEKDVIVDQDQTGRTISNDAKKESFRSRRGGVLSMEDMSMITPRDSNPITPPVLVDPDFVPAKYLNPIPVVAQSYKTIEMSLLNLRANFNTATPEKKEQIISDFEQLKKDHKFFTVMLTPEGQEMDILVVDGCLRDLVSDMIVAAVGEMNEKKFLMGGMAYTKISKANKLDERYFMVEELDLRTPETEKRVLAALQKVMRTPQVDL